jgi:hypothetical protein
MTTDFTSHGFKPDPKTRVGNTFRKLFGTEYKFEVRGTRQPSGLFVAELNIDENVVCRAHNRDWRAAYKALNFEVEKLFADGTSLI